MKFMGLVLFLAACIAAAQSPQATQQPSAPAPTAAPSPAANTIDAAQLAALVKQQFGETFTVTAKIAVPIIIADFNGDGIPDIAIVADSKEPLPDSFAFKYTVADPYHSYFGFGDPRITTSFNADPGHIHDILVIFGGEKDGWRSVTPKAKFVLVNTPFDSISVGRMLVSKKKPPIFVIKALESQIMDSAIFWEPKKKRWRWEPGDTVE